MSILPGRSLSGILPWALSVIVLVSGITATAVYWRHTWQQQQSSLDNLFRAEASRIVATIDHRLDTYQVAMRGIQGFFRGSDRIDYEEFQRYTSSLEATTGLAGVQALAFAVPVSGADIEDHLREMQDQLPVEYQISPPGQRQEMAPIIYIEPLEAGNLPALGFDIFSNPLAREGAELARDTGQMVISPPLSLVQDGDNPESTSFVMYLPVYREGAQLQTLASRRLALLGWVDVPFRMNDLMAGLADEINPGIDFEIHDGPRGLENSFLYHADSVSHEQRMADGEAQVQHSLEVGSRDWTLMFSTTPEFRSSTLLSERFVLVPITGGSMTLALVLLVFVIARRSDRHERKAARLKFLYHALSETNQAIVRMDAEEDLFPLVCRVAVEFGGMQMAWVGRLDETAQHIIPVASYGEGRDYIEGINVSVSPDDAEGRGLTGTALRENLPRILNDYLAEDSARPWHQQARRFGWKAAAAFPVQRGGRPFAVLNVYHSRKDVFDEDAINLFMEMSTDLSFALDNFDREAQRRAFERALVESEQKLSSILENIGACIYVKDREGRYTFVNQQVLELWGRERHEVIGARDDEFFDAHTVARILKNDRRVLQRGEKIECEEVDTVKASKMTRTFWSVKIPLRDADGDIYGLCGISTDITDRKAGEDRINFLSNYDALTGLPNRQLLQEKARALLAEARASRQPVSLMSVDLDRFKLVNESLGHDTGDLVLKELAARMTAMLHMDATLCRLGADDFILLLPATSVETAEELARQLLAVISRAVEVEGSQVVMSASIGIASFPEDGRSFDVLVQAADAALDQAKTRGRNTVQVFTTDMRDQANEIFLIEHELRNAIGKQQLFLHYQPQISIRTGEVVGVEALMRWQHPELGMIPPDRFIPVAEDSGLIIELDAWVMRTAVRQQAQWAQQGVPVPLVAVNLSAIELYHDAFCTNVSAILEEFGLQPAMLECELTESIAMEHSSRTLATLTGLRSIGVSLTIDDFGTGYSSLSYLKRYPVHKLKIDRSFVDGLAADAEDQAIVKAIIGMAKGLGFRTLAEGVETAEQLEFLRLHGCDEYQGYYFSKPVSAGDLEALVLEAKG